MIFHLEMYRVLPKKCPQKSNSSYVQNISISNFSTRISLVLKLPFSVHVKLHKQKTWIILEWRCSLPQKGKIVIKQGHIKKALRNHLFRPALIMTSLLQEKGKKVCKVTAVLCKYWFLFARSWKSGSTAKWYEKQKKKLERSVVGQSIKLFTLHTFGHVPQDGVCDWCMGASIRPFSFTSFLRPAHIGW